MTAHEIWVIVGRTHKDLWTVGWFHSRNDADAALHVLLDQAQELHKAYGGLQMYQNAFDNVAVEPVWYDKVKREFDVKAAAAIDKQLLLIIPQWLVVHYSVHCVSDDMSICDTGELIRVR